MVTENTPLESNLNLQWWLYVTGEHAGLINEDLAERKDGLHEALEFQEKKCADGIVRELCRMRGREEALKIHASNSNGIRVYTSRYNEPPKPYLSPAKKVVQTLLKTGVIKRGTGVPF